MLDNKRMDKFSMRILQELPLDAEAKNSVDELRHIPLQTKVDIYDTKCVGCGFSLQVVLKDGRQIAVFENDMEGAIKLVASSTYQCHIERTCGYPSNCIETNDGIETPSLTEIIMNTCRFWDPKKLENDEEENTEILSDGQIPEHRLFGKIYDGSFVSE